ncbi:MAG: 2-(1,2-epoxy-1,2-dihydrophenyl)acetyl-CoA isomerase [Hyphomicrobiales bacterium]|nr:MAG: 2-(1,2-epoxy-1,2-dihydrophenyl)acetyl-CoA isomerase [Hyphomicrobiales bacterium]
MTSEPLIVERRGGAMILTLNRPEKLNAFNDDMHAALAEALSEAETDPDIRALLLTGAGRGFCAGQDLGDRDPARLGGPPDLGATIENQYNPLIRRLRAMDKPVVCAVNGVAAGAGANIALACDIVIAARSAKFIQAFCKIGLLPDSGGTWFLPRLVGEARAKGLALLGTPLGAEEAAQWGLIWKAVDDDNLMPEALTMVEGLAGGPSFGLGLIKRTIHDAAGNSLEENLQLECERQRRAGRSPDYAEGVSAFLEKRAPRFTGTEQ